VPCAAERAGSRLRACLLRVDFSQSGVRTALPVMTLPRTTTQQAREVPDSRASTVDLHSAGVHYRMPPARCGIHESCVRTACSA